MRKSALSVSLLVLSVLVLLAGCNGGTQSSPETVATPEFSLSGGTYANPQSLSITTKTSGATIYYTTSGVTPSTSSSVYSGPVAINSTQTVKAYAVKSGCTDSAVASVACTITNPKMDAPTFSPAAGSYDAAQRVTVLSPTYTGNKKIYYTVDGSTPTTSSTYSNNSSFEVTVSSNMTISAFTIGQGYTQSDVSTATYTITNKAVATPIISTSDTSSTTDPVRFISNSNPPTKIYIACPTDGATIHYTTDGTTPDSSSPECTSGSITINGATTVKAIAMKANLSNSAVSTCQFKYVVSSPYASVSSGVFPGSMSVSLASSTSGATIHYTKDGTIPTASSPVYSSAITVDSSCDLKALATKDGYVDSTFVSYHYVIVPSGSIAAPFFANEDGPMVFGTDEVELISVDDADVYYTVDGSTPTSTSTKYTKPFTLNGASTVKAIAIKNSQKSAITSKSFFAHNPDRSLLGIWENSSYIYTIKDTTMTLFYKYSGSEQEIGYRTTQGLNYYVLTGFDNGTVTFTYDAGTDKLKFSNMTDACTRVYGTSGTIAGCWKNYDSILCIDSNGNICEYPKSASSGWVSGVYTVSGSTYTWDEIWYSLEGVSLPFYLSSMTKK